MNNASITSRRIRNVAAISYDRGHCEASGLLSGVTYVGALHSVNLCYVGDSVSVPTSKEKKKDNS